GGLSTADAELFEDLAEETHGRSPEGWVGIVTIRHGRAVFAWCCDSSLTRGSLARVRNRAGTAGPRRAGCDVRGQGPRERIEDHATARAVAQVLVHGEPGPERERQALGQHPHERLAAPGEGHLAHPDARPGADQHQLRVVAVAADREGTAAGGAESPRGL